MRADKVTAWYVAFHRDIRLVRTRNYPHVIYDASESDNLTHVCVD